MTHESLGENLPWPEEDYPYYRSPNISRKLKYSKQLRHLVQGRQTVLCFETEEELPIGIPKEVLPFLTNASDEISGKNNIKNMRFTDRLTTGSGEQMIFAGILYKNCMTKYRFDILSETISPSKYRVEYGYNKCRTEVMALHTPSGQNIHNIHFCYDKNKFSKEKVLKDIVSSSKQFVNYSQTDKNEYKASRSGGPDEIYRFDDTSRIRYGDITRITRPENRTIEIAYYKPGNQYIAHQLISIPTTHIDLREGRVSMIKQTTDTSPYAVPTHFFIYNNVDTPGQNSFTEVYDGFKNLTTYVHDGYYRLTDIYRYVDHDYIGCFAEKFFWGKEKDEGNLKSRAAFGGFGEALSCRTFDYDDRGNVLSENLYGNLTGRCSVQLILDSDGIPIPNGVEFYTKTSVYSDDGYNSLLETYDGRKKTTYRYLPDTDLVTHKFVYDDNGRLCLRHFYFYDSENLLKEEIWDDGSQESWDDLTDVTERHKKYIYPNLTVPFGLPRVICETCIDMQTGTESWIKKIEYSYTPQGYVQKEIHTDGNNELIGTIHRKFDDKGHILEMTDFLGGVTEYRYDPNGNKIFEQGPNKSTHKEFIYDLADRLICETEVHADGKRLSVQHRYDIMSRKIADIDIFGHETRYEYDALGRLIKTVFPVVLDENGNVRCPIEKKQYNALDQLIAVTDPLGNTTYTEYNIRGQPTRITYPDGSQEVQEYSLDGLLEKVFQTTGIQTHYKYDYQGRITQATTYAADGQLLYETHNSYNAFHLISETDAMGVTTHYTYDAAGRLSSKRKGSKFEEYRYDAQSRLFQRLQHTEQGTLIHTTLYDCMDRIIEQRTENSIHETLSKTCYHYDVDGNCIQTIRYLDEGPAITTTEYDTRGKPITVTDPLGNTTRIYYYYDMKNALGQRVLIIEQIDPKGNAIVTEFNTHGKIAAVQYKNVFGEQTHGQRFYYDVKERKRSAAEDIYLSGQYQKTLIYSWEYNGNDQLTAKWQAYGTPEQKVTRYSYNNLGQQVAVNKADGVSLHKEYDEFGRVRHYYSSDNSIDYRYTYDLNHNILTASDSTDTTGRVYNELGNVIHEQLANGLNIDIKYDSFDRPTELKLPNNELCLYSYDEAYLREVKRKGCHSYIQSYSSYNKLGIPNERKSPVGITTSQYSAIGRLVDLSSPQWHEALTYDQVGNIITSTINGETTHYTYDALYQLTQEKGLVNNDYLCDSIHNRIVQNGRQQSFNIHNQLVSDGIQNYKYDLNGNLIHAQSSEGKVIYHYDALDRLINVNANGKHIEYSYDAFNRRMSKKVDGQTEFYLYFDKEELGAYVNGKCKELRILGYGIDQAKAETIAIEKQNNVYYTVLDHAGSIVQLLDEQGQLKEQYTYSAFGEQTTPGTMSPWRFAAKRHDTETNFIYFGERYYIPSQGRWLTEDPISTNDGPNLYAYLHNNPLIYVDRYGHMTEEQNTSQTSSSWWSSTWDYLSSSASNCSQNISSGIERSYEVIRETPDMLSRGCTSAWESVCKAASYTGSCAYDFGDGFLNPDRILDGEANSCHYLGAAFFAASLYTGVGEVTIGLKALSLTTRAISTAIRCEKAVETVAKVSRITNAVTKNTSLCKAGNTALAKEAILFNRGAENVNASANLAQKLSRLEHFQENAAEIRYLSDGRIRYYKAEKISQTSGPTRGACNVTEWNPKTNNVRGWYECRDHAGKVNRVHPKFYNGQEVISPHYPPTGAELKNGLF